MMRRAIIFAVALLAQLLGLSAWVLSHAPTNVASGEALDCGSSPFTDVCEGDWTYPYVIDLYDLGAVSGYPDENPGQEPRLVAANSSRSSCWP